MWGLCGNCYRVLIKHLVSIGLGEWKGKWKLHRFGGLGLKIRNEGMEQKMARAITLNPKP